MNDARVEKFRAVLRDVNELLYVEWAPIGFVGALPKDEYESYAMTLVSMLAGSASEAEIAAYLVGTAQAITGDPGDEATAVAVAKRLAEYREVVRAIAV